MTYDEIQNLVTKSFFVGVGMSFGGLPSSCIQDLRAHQASPVYMAPELFMEDGIHSTASDLWAFGCVLYEMATGSPPFLAETFESLWEMIMCGM